MEIKPQSVLQGMAGAILFLAIVAGAQTPSSCPILNHCPRFHHRGPGCSRRGCACRCTGVERWHGRF